MTHLLVVEDSPFDAELLQATLREQGSDDLRVTLARRLGEALALLGEGNFDVILLDLTLPDGWGGVVFERMHQAAPQIPIVIWTGLADPELALNTVRLGAQDYLLKDEVQERTLLRAISHAIERKRLHVEAQRLRQEAVEMERRKTEFLATVSHELRNPMTGVIGFLELLRKTALSPLQAEYLDAVHQSSRTMLGMLHGLLDLSSAESGHVHVEMAPLRLRDCLENLAAFVVPQAQSRELEVVCGVDPLLPDEVLGDHLRLRQVLLNFLGNALKFTEEGYIGLFARVRSHTADTVVVRFVVEDSGRGIPTEKKEQIFSPFKQTRSDDRARGAGLGLSISKRLIAAMGGVLGLESEPGQGSAFWFDLPFAVREASSLVGRLQGTTVLLGENHAPTVEALAFAVQRMGGEVGLATTPEQVRELASRYSLVVSRWPIPGCLFSSYVRAEEAVARPVRLKDLASPAPVVLSPEPVRTEFWGTVLLVDEEPCRPELLASLESHGVHCLQAAGGKQALRSAVETDFDLVLVTEDLADTQGETLARQLRRLQNCPILAVTATPAGVLLEFDAALRRPLNAEPLLVWLEPPAGELVDWEVLERFRPLQRGANRHLIRDLVDTFCEGAPRRMRALLHGWANSRSREVRRLAHQLRGAAGSVGAVAVAGWCRQIERTPTDETMLWRLQRDLCRTLHSLLRELRKEGTRAETAEPVPAGA